MNEQSAIKDLLKALNIKVFTVERTVAETWWNHACVVSPFSPLWLVMGGHGTMRHHGRVFNLCHGVLHLDPAFTEHDRPLGSSLDWD